MKMKTEYLENITNFELDEDIRIENLIKEALKNKVTVYMSTALFVKFFKEQFDGKIICKIEKNVQSFV